MVSVKKTFMLGNQSVTLETGKMARQATGAVLASMGGTVVLATVVAKKEVAENSSFFPLSVHYQEKFYAAGKIPGGFLKREGRATERETLISRLIDRPVRPLFPKGFMNEVQLIIAVLSFDKETDPDILAMLSASAVLSISGLPFQGPMAGVRVGLNEEQGYILNPTLKELKTSELDMVVAGTKDAVLMVESEAKELTEDEMLGAVLFAQQEYQTAIEGIEEFSAAVNAEKWHWEAPKVNQALVEKLQTYESTIREAYQITIKQDRSTKLSEIKQQVLKVLVEESNEFDSGDVEKAFSSLEKSIVRGNILAGQPRIDGRDHKTVRSISVEVGLLPKTHGSSLFTRGETQALVTTTLGTMRDSQLIETLESETRDHFIFHYNFPSYSVGECGRVGMPGRREIGHGRLAKRGLQAVLPNIKEFPYTMRVVSEITESNGSSSMASACGASLALMDAGVPLTAPVAGIAMGLVKDGDRFSVLTDILGDEDHLGDMDFKVAGTDEGITALQMDIKIAGITEEIMEQALNQALAARLEILAEMAKVLASSRTELNENAPMTLTLKIDPDKIRDIIGKGGSMIRSICEETGASVDIDDDGLVKIFADDKTKAQAAYDRVFGITAEAEIGKVYLGEVTRILDFGAFINILPSKDGLVHISQISEERVENISDYLQVGQKVDVRVVDIDSRGRIKLSMKDVSRA